MQSFILMLRQYGYDAFLFLGALSMFALLLIKQKENHLSYVKIIIFSILLLICGISGAKFMYWLEHNGKSMSGMSFFGAVFLIPILMPAFGYYFDLKKIEILNLCAPCVASMIMFMRLGCFCAGCCGGMLSKIIGFKWPTQLIESIGDFLILLWLLYLGNQKKKENLYAVFLINYGFLRFFIEFLRDTPKLFFGLSNGQIFSIIAIVIGNYFKSGGQSRVEKE